MSLVLGGAIAGLFLWIAVPKLLRRLVRRRLSGYRAVYAEPNEALPRRTEDERRIAVLGGGVAGLVAAVTLARRGFRVTLFEKNEYLGGKLGSWREEIAPGREVWQSHGFHAFFPHYDNFHRFLDSVDSERGGLRRGFRSIGEYVILGKNGDVIRFGNADRTPVFNLLSLWRSGVFSLGDAFRPPGRDLYGIFLEYDHERTFTRYDHLSFAEFSRRAEVPPRLKLAFNTFARAFFAEEDRLSFAELTKSFHFYYLSHDGGLVYDFPTKDYDAALLTPIRRELEGLGGEVRLGTPAPALRYDADSGEHLVGEERFSDVVLSTDVRGVKAIAEHASGWPEAVRRSLTSVRAGQRYSVLRVWLDRDVRADIPVFVITERKRVLDAVTLYHRFEEETQADLDLRGGKSVLELHSYAVPDALPDDEVESALLDELFAFFPELTGANVLGRTFQLRDDFTAFHVGLYASRPTTETGIPGLYCAGDWVKLPFPAMLLECAASSGLWAANAILRRYGLSEELVTGVPLRGMMAGIPEPPARRILEPQEKR